MAWLLLVAAGLLEIVWATALKQSDGLARLTAACRVANPNAGPETTKPPR